MDEITHRALLVGNGTFTEDPHNLPSLKGPPNDLRLLRDVLTHPQVGLHGAEAVNLLLDRTCREILRVAESFFSDAQRNDQLLFYYSGHGRLDRHSNLYLCARDTCTDALVSTAISDEVINSMIRNSRSSRVVIILDCCHSGRFKGGELPGTLAGEGRFVLTSSRARELSEDTPDQDGPSAFTKHLVSALWSGEVDANTDGYVSINEVYEYVLPKLIDETKQRPQRHYDKAYGELALGRAASGSAAPGSSPPEPAKAGRPILAVSETSIEMADVTAGEDLREEIIDVYNEGGGSLDWDVQCDDDWITLRKEKGHFAMKLAPRPGVNRGRIHVRDRGAGGSKTVRVTVRVDEEPEPPKLVLSADRVDFGSVSRGAELAPEMVRLENAGGGELGPRVSSVEDWVEARLRGDILEVVLDTSHTGRYRGRIVLDTNGGSATIPVAATIESGPVLRVSPASVDFGEVAEGESKEARLSIGNSGGGTLDWKMTSRGEFFRAEKAGDSVSVVLDAGPGHHRGTVFVTSNGGDATVDVEAVVTPAMETTAPGSVDIEGTWALPGLGSYVFVRSGAQYRMQELNLLGIVCGEGMATVQGSMVTVQGWNALAGQYTGQFAVTGSLMTGQVVTALGMATSLSLARA